MSDTRSFKFSFITDNFAICTPLNHAEKHGLNGLVQFVVA
jgi:hypothetical protein